MTRERYVFAPIFGVRPTGVPFDVLERLGTPAASAAARRVVALGDEHAACAARILAELPARLPADRTLRSQLNYKLKRGTALAGELVAAHPWLAPYARAGDELRRATAELEALLGDAAVALHETLQREAARELPDFLAFESEGLAELDLAPSAPARTAKQRPLDRTLALYLQRVCAKNDTISRFGPIAWGRVVAGEGVVVRPVPGVARRRVEVERWVVRGLIELINADPEASAPLAPFARDSTPLASLRADVDAWPDGPARERWRARIAPLAELADRFAVDPGAAGRRAIVGELRAHLEQLGMGERGRTRALYAANNPINENCFQDGTFTIGERQCEAIVDDAWPWFELFRDTVAFAAMRAFDQIHELVTIAPRRDGKLVYSTLAQLARERGPGIAEDALQLRAGREAFADVRRELAEQLAGRGDAREWQLTAEDCTFLRRRHALPPAGELAFPSADLQVIAASPEDAEAGRVEWVIAELHFALVLLQQAAYWACPDKPLLHACVSAAVEHATIGAREGGSGAPVHVDAEAMMTALRHPMFVGSGRPKPGWPAARPDDCEVIVDEERRDIRLRAGDRDAGSLVRVPALVSGAHPFFPFARVPHEPRLRVGKVIVQREGWYITSAELGEPRPTGVSAAFVVAIERVRAARGIPRWVFARPAPGVLGGGNWDRDKDHKPMYVDLESLVFLDILERRLRKYGTLAVTEMLPAPDQLIWRTPAGRYTFELRTNVIDRALAVPRSS